MRRFAKRGEIDIPIEFVSQGVAMVTTGGISDHTQITKDIHQLHGIDQKRKIERNQSRSLSHHSFVTYLHKIEQ